MKEKRVQMTLTFTQDTKDRLREYADEHRTSVSQAITNWIWATQLRAEMEKKSGDE